jgi:hypothetical protein
MRTASHRAFLWIACIALAATAVTGCARRAPAVSDEVDGDAALEPAAAPEAAQAYRIQPSDELHIRFTYQPEMNEQVPVRPDGRNLARDERARSPSSA